MLSLVRHAVVTLTFLAGVGLLTVLLACRLTGPFRWWPIAALDSLTLYGFAPFLLVATVGLLTRSRSLGILWLAALLLFGEQFDSQILSATGLTTPPVVITSQDQPRLRILTMNLHAPNDDPAPFAALVREADPDVVVFQEVTTDFARAFDRQLGAMYPFSATAGTGANHFGSGTWSRLPLGVREPLGLGVRGNTMHRVQILTGPSPIWLYNVHLANPMGENREESHLDMLRRFDTTRRDDQLACLIDQSRALNGPYILAGDFNTAASSYLYRHFPAEWQDAYALAGVGFGNTYPSPAHQERNDLLRLIMPMIRLDYVLTSPDFQPLKTWTRALPQSDHLALIVDLAPQFTRAASSSPGATFCD